MDKVALHRAIAAVAPIAGIRTVKKVIIIDYLSHATDQHKADAQSIIDNWIDPLQSPDDRAWNQLSVDLLGSDLWKHTKTASKQSLGANTAFTVIVAILTVTKQIDQFALAWVELRNEFVATSVGDFNQGQLDDFALLLQRNSFDTELFDLVQ